MKGFKLSFNSLGYLVQELTKLLQSKKTYRINVVEWREKRSLSQNAFQHVIYSDISKYLISKGRKDWTPEFTKKNMKNNFLGWEQEGFVDVKTGEVTTSMVLRSTAKLDVGESGDYTTKLLDFACSIGCEIKIPADSDYMKYLEEQNR